MQVLRIRALRADTEVLGINLLDKEAVKALHALAPMNSPALHDQIFKEILEPGERFTTENTDEFKSGIELLGKLLTIHSGYKERHPFGDMFSEYLMEHGRLNANAGQFFTPYNIVDMMTEMLLTIDAESMRGEPLTMLDPAAGTGRFMLRTAKHYQGDRDVQLHLHEHRH